ncbi:MAG: glycerophosphoryl diester phosphodiesterase [Bacteroidia bacterium]
MINRIHHFGFLFGLILILVSCGSFPEKGSINNISGGQISALGHGGMGSRALIPMNSWESLEACFELGPDGTEVDVQMTKDGVLVCYHDEKLDKTTTCHGTISDVTWEELISGCEYYTWSSSKSFARLDSVIAKFGSPGIMISLDLKESGPSHAHNLRMRGQILRLAIMNPEIDFLIESWDATGAWGFENPPENMRFFQLCADPLKGLEIARNEGLNGISIDYRKINKEQCAQIHAEGFYVMVYGANTASGNKEAVALSPDIIQSDRLGHLLDGLAKYN